MVSGLGWSEDSFVAPDAVRLVVVLDDVSTIQTVHDCPHPRSPVALVQLDDPACVVRADVVSYAPMLCRTRRCCVVHADVVVRSVHE